MANKELLITLGLDSSTFSQNVKRAKDLTKELDSEFKLASSSSEKFENNLSGLAKKQDYLSDRIKIATGLTEVYAKRMQESQDKLEESKKASTEYAEKCEELAKKIEQVGKGSEEYSALAKELKSYTQQHDKAEKAVQTHTKRILSAQDAYNNVQAELQSMGKEVVLVSEKMSAMRADSKIEALSNDISELDNTFKFVKNSVSDFDKTMDGLYQTQNYYNEKIALTEKKLKNYSDEITNSTEKIKYHELSVRDLSKELAEQEEILKSLKANDPNYDEVREKVESLRAAYSESNAILEFHSNRVEKLSRDYNETEQELGSLSGSLDSNTKKMKKMAESITFEPVSKEIKELTNSVLDKLSVKCKEVEKEFELLSTEVTNYENSLTGLNKKQETYNNILNIAKRELDEYDKEMLTAKTTVEQLTSKQQELEKEIQLQIKALQKLDGAEWDKQAKSIEKLKEEYQDVNKQLNLHTDRLKVVEKGYDSTKVKIAKVTSELGKTEKQLEVFKKNKYFDGLDSDIKNITNKMSLLDSKFDVARSAVEKFGTSTKDLATKQEYVANKIELLINKTKSYNESVSATEREVIKLSSKKKELANTIDSLKASIDELDKSSPDYNKQVTQLIKLEAEYEEVSKEVETYKDKLNKLQVELNQTTAETNELARVQDNLKTAFYSTNLQDFGSKLQGVGQVATSTGQSLIGITAAVGGIGGASIKTGMDFSTAMSEVQAVTGATRDELQSLENIARQLGESTTFTATQCAEGLKYLGLAGYSASEAIDTLPSILALAQAGAMELSTASDLATDSVAAMGYVGAEAVKILPDYLDKVAVSAANSNTSVQQMMEAYVKVGGQLNNMNISLDQSGAMLGVLANRGLKAAESGVSLNSILINLTKETGQSSDAIAMLSERLGYTQNLMFDAEGNMRDIEDCFLDIAKAMQGLTQQEQINIINMIGGKTQVKTLNALMNGMIDSTGNLTEEYKELKAELEAAPDLDALQKMSETMTDNLAGDFARLKSAIQESFLSIMDSIGPSLRECFQSLTKKIQVLTEKFTNLSPEMQMFILKTTAIAAALPPLLILFGSMAIGLGSIIEFGGKAIKTLGLFNSTTNIATKFTGFLTKGISIFGTTISGATVLISGAVVALGAIVTAIGQSERALANLQEKWGVFGVAIGAICESISGSFVRTFSTTFTFFSTLGKSIIAIIKGDWRNVDDIWKEGLANIKMTFQKTSSDITAESTRAISKIRKMTEEELLYVNSIFDTSLSKLPNITKDNLSDVASEFTQKLSDIDNTTISILKGTSDTMVTLFNGIKEGMDTEDMQKQLEKNMKTLLNAGKLSASELEREFSAAQDLIASNMAGSFDRAKSHAEDVMDEVSKIAVNGVEKTANSIGSLVSKMDQETLNTLRNTSGEWGRLLADLGDTTNMSTKEISEIILNNLNKLGVDTPQGIQKLLDNLESSFGTLAEEIEETADGVAESVEAITLNSSESINAILETLGSGGEVTREMAETIVGYIEQMGSETAQELSNSCDYWYALLYGAFDENGQLSEGFVDTVLGNLNYLSVDSPEELATFVETLQEGLTNANIVVDEQSSEMVNTIEETTEEMTEETASLGQKTKEALEPVCDAFKKIGDKAKEGYTIAKEATVEFSKEQWENITELHEKLKVKVSEISEGIGKFFSDLKESILSKFTEIKNSIIEKFNEIHEGISGAFKKTGEFIKETFIELKDSAANYLKELKDRFIFLIKNFSELLGGAIGNIAGAIVGSISGSAGGIILTIKNIFAQIGDMFKGAFKALKGLFKGNIDELTQGLKDALKGLLGIGKELVVGVWNIVTGTIENILNVFALSGEKYFKIVEDFFSNTWQKMSETLDNMIESVVSWGVKTKEVITTWCSETWQMFTTWCSETWQGFTQWCTDLKTNIPIWFNELKESFAIWCTETWQGFTQWCSDTWNGFTQWCTVLKTNIPIWFNEIKVSFFNWCKETKDNFINWVSDTWTRFKQWGSDMVANARTSINEWKNKLVEGWNNAKTEFKNWCSNMLSALGGWFSDLITNTKNKVAEWGNVFKNGVETIKSFFFELPSYMFNIGANIVNSLISGFNSMFSSFKNVVSSSINTVLDKFRMVSVEASVTQGETSTPAEVSELSDGNVASFKARNNIGEMMSNSIKSAFSLNNYKTSGGYYSAKSMSNSKSATSSNDSLLNALIQQNQILMQLLTADRAIEVGVNVDGRAIARASAKYMESELNSITYRKNRLGGLI